MEQLILQMKEPIMKKINKQRLATLIFVLILIIPFGRYIQGSSLKYILKDIFTGTITTNEGALSKYSKGTYYTTQDGLIYFITDHDYKKITFYITLYNSNNQAFKGLTVSVEQPIKDTEYLIQFYDQLDAKDILLINSYSIDKVEMKLNYFFF